MDRSEALHLSVGRTHLRASSPAGTHTERKVKLPDRWVRGFAELPALSLALRPAAKLSGLQIGRFLGGLPRVGPPGPTWHLLPVPGGLRSSRVPIEGGLTLAGTARLRGCDRIARHATQLTVHTSPIGTTAWIFDLPGGRFTVVLSPAPFRAFSGEGSLLALLTEPDAERHGRRLLAPLGWTPTVDPVELGQRTGLTGDQVAAGLGWLAASGRLGYDLAEARYFHRELPLDSEKVLRRNPRLVEAGKLLDGGGVVRRPGGGWAVRAGAGGWYSIGDGEPLRCECAWQREHDGTRGPCKHLLAVLLARARTTAGGDPDIA